MNIQKVLYKKVTHALITAGVPSCAAYDAQVDKSVNSNFGDYQVNGIMKISKKINVSSQELAEKVVKLLDLDKIVWKIEIIYPGFINFFLKPKWLSIQISEALSSPRLGISKVDIPKTIVIDYSAPNIAKEMHVGHLRSTIIGDSMVRILSFLGHNIIRANHIGDWGTQFGMLIAYLEKIDFSNKKEIKISNLETFYRKAKKHYDEDKNFSKLARDYVVKLQNGDNYCRNIWKKLVNISIKNNQKIYDRLNVTLTQNDIMGESIYNDMLPNIVSDLKDQGLAVEINGSTVVFLDFLKNKKGETMGVIIKKNDGAYLYTTTDIACLKYRYEKLKADRIIYYIDSRQHQHIMQVLHIVRKAGYVPKSVSIEHHMFGMMFNKYGKPFKTRTGDTIKLTELLDEAQNRAKHLILKKNANIKGYELERLSKIIGIGSIKYADLSKNRTTNYVFDWNQMLSFDGNTAPYILYAYSRIISLLKRSCHKEKDFIKSNIILETSKEIKLAVCLLQFEEVLFIVARNGFPHILCNYLYNLASLFSLFYEHCKIILPDNEFLFHSRLKLALLTALTLKQGLNLLGIDTTEKM